MKKHTEGPWRIQMQGAGSGCSYRVVSASDSIIALCMASGGSIVENANLMAVAPEMLEAIEAIIHLAHLDQKFDHHGNTARTLRKFADEKLKPIVAKAKGETQ